MRNASPNSKQLILKDNESARLQDTTCIHWRFATCRTHREARSRAWVSLFSAYLYICFGFRHLVTPLITSLFSFVISFKSEKYRIPRYSDVDDPTGDLEQRILRRHSLQSLYLVTEAFMMGIFYPCMDPCIFKHIFEWKDLSGFVDLTSLTHWSSGRMIQEFGKRLSKLMADWLRVGWPWDACHSASDVDSDVVNTVICDLSIDDWLITMITLKVLPGQFQFRQLLDCQRPSVLVLCRLEDVRCVFFCDGAKL